MPKQKIDLLYAIGLPPEKAVEYFKSKGYAFSWNWWDIWQEAHTIVFTVAKAMRDDILQDIRDIVQKAIEEGLSFRSFQKLLEPRLKAKGWWGKAIVGDETGAQQVQLGSPWRLRTIYRTNMQTSFMAGRYRTFMEMTDNRPYWQYVAVLDSRTRPSHRALHGKVFRYDDPFWNYFFPPNGWHCRCSVRALSEKNIRDRGLVVENSEGRISMKEVPISKSSDKTAEVAVYMGYHGERIVTDAGWSYNPGIDRRSAIG